MGKTRTGKPRKEFVPAVPVDPEDFVRTPEEIEAFHAEMDRLFLRPTVGTSHHGPTRDFPAGPLSRDQVERSYRTALLLGSWNPVSTLALCQELIRLHDVMAAVALCLQAGQFSEALTLARSEADPEWGNPLDPGTVLKDDDGPGQREAESQD